MVDKITWLVEGSVTRRDDPENLGRVKIRIPGLIEPETPDWVFPIGIPGGGTVNRGHFEPPAIGANVAVLFKNGDINRPRYLTGPWGAPGGTADTPTNAAIDTGAGSDKRQNAVTEDEEWLIERDSRSATPKYLLRHKGSSLAILIDGSSDKVYITREDAAQALVLGTQYRTAEVSAMSNLVAILDGLVTALNSFALDPTFAAAFPTAAGILTTFASVTYPPLKSAFTSLDWTGTASAYLSAKAFTE